MRTTTERVPVELMQIVDDIAKRRGIKRTNVYKEISDSMRGMKKRVYHDDELFKL